MKKHLAFALGVLLVAGSLSGCGKSTKNSAPLGNSSTNGTAMDQAQVNDVLAANPTVVDEDVYQSALLMSASEASTGFAAITPRHWWRRITSVERSFDTQFGNPDSNGNFTTALVTIHKRLQGTFNIVVGDSELTDSSRTVIHKPLDDRWERRILLHRTRTDTMSVGDSTVIRSRWRIVGVSGVQVTSRSAVTRIQSIRIQAGLVDTLITDPLQLHRLRKLIWIAHDTQVQVTVVTGSPDDQVFLYHRDGRVHFHANGDGSFSIRWTTGDFGGLRHFGVDGIAKSALFDDVAPYDSQAWIVPFAVRGEDRDIEHNCR